jgi:alkylation response protein AidB-like acyl-CoA dehydrogenase
MKSIDLITGNCEDGERQPLSWEWLAVAEEVASRLAVDALERDRSNVQPKAEIDLIREAGLLSLTIPAECGGAGESYRTAFNVVRILARVDPSIAQIVGYHLDIVNRILEARGDEMAYRVMTDCATNRWLLATGGTAIERKLVDVTDAPGGDFYVTGERIFATGSGVADRIRAFGVHEPTGDRLVMLIDPNHPSVTRTDEWDFLGQRLSASSGLIYKNYPLPERDIIARYPPPQTAGAIKGVSEYIRPLTVLSQEVVFTHIYLGISEGSLDFARRYTREHSKPFMASGLEKAVDDPYIQNGYGGLVARASAAAALADRAEAELQWGYDQGGEGAALDSDQLAAIYAIVSSAKFMAEDVALESANRMLSFMGARSAASKWGTDRFWRNIRTLSLHDPIAYHLRRVGIWFLSDAAEKSFEAAN